MHRQHRKPWVDPGFLLGEVLSPSTESKDRVSVAPFDAIAIDLADLWVPDDRPEP